jgi:hypothetical protein
LFINISMGELAISDYTVAAMYTRYQAVQALMSAKIDLPADGDTTWLSIAIHSDGTAGPGPTLQSDLPIEGEPRAVELRDAAGNVVEVVRGTFVPYSNLPGGIVAFRAPSAVIDTARVDGLAPISLR